MKTNTTSLIPQEWQKWIQDWQNLESELQTVHNPCIGLEKNIKKTKFEVDKEIKNYMKTQKDSAESPGFQSYMERIGSLTTQVSSLCRTKSSSQQEYKEALEKAFGDLVQAQLGKLQMSQKVRWVDRLINAEEELGGLPQSQVAEILEKRNKAIAKDTMAAQAVPRAAGTATKTSASVPTSSLTTIKVQVPPSPPEQLIDLTGEDDTSSEDPKADPKTSPNTKATICTLHQTPSNHNQTLPIPGEQREANVHQTQMSIRNEPEPFEFRVSNPRVTEPQPGESPALKRSAPSEEQDTDRDKKSRRLVHYKEPKETINFDKVYSDGKAETKYGIVPFKFWWSDTQEWYILRCKKCVPTKSFRFNSIESAADHWNMVHSGTRKPSAVIQNLGVKVLGCTEQLAERNNRAVEESQQATQPLDARKPMKPQVGQIYNIGWSPSAWAAMVLPLEGPCHQATLSLTIEGLGLTGEKLPKCYQRDDATKTLVLRKEFEDDGPSASEREYPVLFFNSLYFPIGCTTAWRKARNFAEFDPTRLEKKHVQSVETFESQSHSVEPAASLSPGPSSRAAQITVAEAPATCDDTGGRLQPGSGRENGGRLASPSLSVGQNVSLDDRQHRARTSSCDDISSNDFGRYCPIAESRTEDNDVFSLPQNDHAGQGPSGHTSNTPTPPRSPENPLEIFEEALNVTVGRQEISQWFGQSFEPLVHGPDSSVPSQTNPADVVSELPVEDISSPKAVETNSATHSASGHSTNTTEDGRYTTSTLFNQDQLLPETGNTSASSSGQQRTEDNTAGAEKSKHSISVIAGVSGSNTTTAGASSSTQHTTKSAPTVGVQKTAPSLSENSGPSSTAPETADGSRAQGRTLSKSAPTKSGRPSMPDHRPNPGQTAKPRAKGSVRKPVKKPVKKALHQIPSNHAPKSGVSKNVTGSRMVTLNVSKGALNRQVTAAESADTRAGDQAGPRDGAAKEGAGSSSEQLHEANHDTPREPRLGMRPYALMEDDTGVSYDTPEAKRQQNDFRPSPKMSKIAKMMHRTPLGSETTQSASNR